MESRSEVQFMNRALTLAEKKGRYASPNPKVGAVLVKKGRVVGEGAHSRYGGPHAEVMALRTAGKRAKGATLYVTLEPCDHFGKTPPCSEALIRAGVGKVVAAMKDPFPLVRGKGFRRLAQAGIPVRTGILEGEARALNQPFIFSASHGRPRILLKAAISLDGKIAPPPGQSPWITGEKARRKAHEIRSRVDAILVGSETARKDDPSLTVRLPGFRRKDGWPLRVLLDSRLEISPAAKLFRGGPRTVVFASPQASLSRERALKKRGIQVFRVPLIKKMLSLKAVLRTLHSLQVRSLLVEGGGEVHASFLRGKLVDEAVVFIAPRLLGEKAQAWAGRDGVDNLKLLSRLKSPALVQVGVDFMLTGGL